MASPLAIAKHALSDPIPTQSEAAWAALASDLGVGGASLEEAIEFLADEQGTFTSARSWHELVRRYVAREEAFGRSGPGDTPYPLLRVCPTRGGSHPSLSTEEYERILRRTSVSETEVSVLPSEAVAVVRNRAGAVWSVDLRPEHWGQMIWGVFAPSPKRTMSVLVRGTYLLIQRVDPFFPFQMEMEVYSRKGCQPGKFNHLGTIPGTELSGCSDMVEDAIPVALAGDVLAALRLDGTLAMFHLEVRELIKVIPLPEEVQSALVEEEEDRCSHQTSICFVGLRTVLLSVRGDVLGVDLEDGTVIWRLSNLFAHLTALRANPASTHNANTGTLRPVLLEPIHISAQESMGTAKMQVEQEGPSVVFSTPSTLIVVPNLGEARGWVITLPQCWSPPSPPQPAFHGPLPPRGSGLSVSHSRVLWTTHLAPLLLDFSHETENEVRMWDLWPGAGTKAQASAPAPVQGYEDTTLSLIRAMAQHQDWFPQAVLTHSGAYLLGTLRGAASGPDDPLPQSSQIVVWEFGRSALLRLGLDEVAGRTPGLVPAMNLPRPPRSRARRRARPRSRSHGAKHPGN